MGVARTAKTKEALEEYERRRDFEQTPEPKGRRRPSGGKGHQPHFVVQQHDASRLHYDFRLEVDGVMKSWAVPKGPSLNPKQKRLAVPTEDHPLEYRDFEGTIPEGEYGAGTVVVWDTGTFRNLTERDGKAVPLDKALSDGHAAIWLEGRKLRGGFALTRFRTGKDEAWLLVKMDDEEANTRRDPVRDQPESVLTGRTLAEVASGSGAGHDPT
ncbi:MAG TPA: DNA polymerase ligase N-terminal domain-containing protein [Acidimicrobiales bacterium]|jgi:DNA ligase D-like protein (predicted 3'-phosphoesterase)|nr:DNA polymerase ligase N-terminal domain-containing protein [Acidimicrobiales bacterium]